MVTVSSNIPLRVIKPRPERVVVCLFMFLNILIGKQKSQVQHRYLFMVSFFSFGISLYFIRYIQKSGGLLKKQRCVFNAKTSRGGGGRFKGSFVGTVLAAETLRF